MATPESETRKHLDALYDAFAKARSDAYEIVPLNPGELHHMHSLRIAVASSKNAALEHSMNLASSAGHQFANAFALAGEKGLCTKFFEESGLARALNVFHFVYPFAVMKWLRAQQPIAQELPADITWARLLEYISCDSELRDFWFGCIVEYATYSRAPFNDVTLDALLPK